MQQSQFTTTILKAEENHYLTQVDKNIPILDRLFCREVALGLNDSPANWKEITEEEYNELYEEQNKARVKWEQENDL